MKIKINDKKYKSIKLKLAYTLDKILNEIKGAEEKWIEISDISDKLFE